METEKNKKDQYFIAVVALGTLTVIASNIFSASVSLPVLLSEATGFIVIMYLIFYAVPAVFRKLGNYYSKWYYFPKIQMSADITPKNEIELTIINPKKRQNLSLRAVYARVDSDVRLPMGLTGGVAPDSVKELLPLASMNGKSSRTEKIGRIEDGCLILSGGKNNPDVMKFIEPGLYEYTINLYGKLNGRNYGVHGIIPIRITESHEIIIEKEKAWKKKRIRKNKQ